MLSVDIRCRVCGDSGIRRCWLTRDYNWGFSGLFVYHRCESCRAVFQDERLIAKPLEEYYPRFYGTNTALDPSNFSVRIDTPANRMRAAVTEAHCSGRTILDVGCGSGFFLRYMQRRGWVVRGIEPAVEHVEFVRQMLKIDGIVEGTWPQAAGMEKPVDVVSFIHVIEHLRYPVEDLAVAKDILRPGGVVVIETPNVNSWPAKLFGSRWVTLDAPRHVTLFSAEALQMMLEKAGFKPLLIRTFSSSTIEYTESIRYVLRDFGLYPPRGAAEAKPKAFAEKEVGKRASAAGLRKKTRRTLHAAENKLYRCVNLLSDKFGYGCNLLAVAQLQ